MGAVTRRLCVCVSGVGVFSWDLDRPRWFMGSVTLVTEDLWHSDMVGGNKLHTRISSRLITLILRAHNVGQRSAKQAGHYLSSLTFHLLALQPGGALAPSRDKGKAEPGKQKMYYQIWWCQLSHHVFRNQTPWPTSRVPGFHLPSSVGRKRPPRGDMYDALSRNDPALGEAQPFHAIPRDICNISHARAGTCI